MLTKEDVNINVYCEPEHMPIKGNVSAIDEETDKRMEQYVKDQLETGNEWAWCIACVEVEWNGLTDIETLGGCVYLSKDHFMNDEYYNDMLNEAITNLNRRIEQIVEDYLETINTEV